MLILLKFYFFGVNKVQDIFRKAEEYTRFKNVVGIDVGECVLGSRGKLILLRGKTNLGRNTGLSHTRVLLLLGWWGSCGVVRP